MPTQVQIRGTTQATQEARTLASRELDVNTTDNRIVVHDGSTSGGIPHINYRDHINQEYTYAAASGTDTITMSLAIAPAAYATGQKFCFKAAATNTGSATLNVNSLGAKTIKKKDVGSGSITTLSAGDIIIGAIYSVFYDGTDMVLEAVDGGGLTTVSQSDLNTSTGTVSTTDTDGVKLTLPGGTYGFYPQFKHSATSVNAYAMPVGGHDGAISSTQSMNRITPTFDTNTHLTTSYVSVITMATRTGTVSAQQRYVTASPPYDLGDGEIAGFIFLLLDKNGDIKAHYAADTPPWAYNGPTNIAAQEICRLSGKKYRHVVKKCTVEEIIAGKKPQLVRQEITHKIKNADINLFPHPFGNPAKGHSVVCIDLLGDKVRNLIDYQNNGGGEDVTDFLNSGKFVIDNEVLDLKSPKGVSVHKLKL